MTSRRYYENLTRWCVVKFPFQHFGTNKKKLTLARISPKNVHLHLFGGAHFH